MSCTDFLNQSVRHLMIAYMISLCQNLELSKHLYCDITRLMAIDNVAGFINEIKAIDKELSSNPLTQYKGKGQEDDSIKIVKDNI